MKTIMPASIDENFGIGCAEEALDRVVIDPVFKPYVQKVVEMSRVEMGVAVNWIDANLHDTIRCVMLDKQGNEIDEECTDTTFRVEDGRVMIVINDQTGSKAFFDLGPAEEIWGDSLKGDQPVPTPAKPRVLVTVSGGVADYVADEGVDVEVFDHDNFKADPVGTAPVPVHFRDLAEPVGVPVATIADPETRVRLLGKPDEWTTWNICQNLTDRWGDFNYYARAEKPLEELESNPELLARLREQMWDEICFVVRKDGKFGILFEVEYVSIESEGDRAKDYPDPLKPHAEMIKIINDAAMEKLVPHFPGVEFSIPHEDEICDGRPALWAFVADGLLNAEQREALGRAMLEL